MAASLAVTGIIRRFPSGTPAKAGGKTASALGCRWASSPSWGGVDLMEGSYVCFAPVLDPCAAMMHPHIAARGIYSEPAGVLQAAPAPRFSSGKLEPGPVPGRGQHSADILREAGSSESEIESLLAIG